MKPHLEPVVRPPSLPAFRRMFEKLSLEYDDILVLTGSSDLCPVAARAAAAAAQVHTSTQIEILDTRTTSIGLGWLVELAAAAAQAGERNGEVIKQVRTAMRRIYFLLHIPDLDALVCSGQISRSQALAATMLGMLPIFNLEEGRLVPLAKVRSHRAVLEFFQEFLCEFDSPRQVAVVRGTSQPSTRTSPLRQHIHELHLEARFKEHVFTPVLDLLLGSRGLGLAIFHKG